MKHLLMLAFIAVLTACNGTGQKQKTCCANDNQVSKSSSFSSIDSLLHQAVQMRDKEVELTAVVSHTCKHAGKRCFLIDATGNETIRIEAGGAINGFNRELTGKTIRVKGILKERRLTEEYINQWAEALQEKKVKEDGSAETCAAENNNITQMREWMKSNGKDYYSIYYIDGQDYDLVQ